MLESKVLFINLFYVPFVGFLLWAGVDKEALLVFAILLAIDIVTGLGKAYRLGHKWKSVRLANGIISKCILILIPLVMALVAKGLHLDISTLVFIVIDALILSEAYSIIENIYVFRSGKDIEEFDVLSLILKQIRNTLNKVLGDINE